MYGVLRQMPAGFSEADFCVAIADYLEEMITLVAPTEGVYVSIDGVVCAAKRRQQRLRRFKGPWLARLEKAQTATTWDQNALTPGTEFMARLADVLGARCRRIAARRGIPVILSSAAEPGEGEHKLMAHMRCTDRVSKNTPKTCTIYGLDADLILLAMLLVSDGFTVRLLREAQEFERGTGDEWRSLDVTALADVLFVKDPAKIRDFVAAMSLLGNDFLPRSLTKTVRDDCPGLIAGLERVWAAGLRLTDSGLNAAGLIALLEPWTADEDGDLRAAARAGEQQRRRCTGDFASLPAQWGAVCAASKEMYAAWHPGTAANYVAGLAWIWDYYMGRPVDLSWSFDEHLPPLWSDVVAELRQGIRPPPLRYTEYLPPSTHLFAVLPEASMARLLPSHLSLIYRMPWYWPTGWSVFDVGRTQMWECEPVIPVLDDAVLRTVKLDQGIPA